MNLVPLKTEGAAVHPDEMGALSDQQYARQLRAYYESTGDYGVFVARREIRDVVLAEVQA